MDSAKSPSKKLLHVPSLSGAFLVTPPGSKSIANRALPLATLAKYPDQDVTISTVANLPDGDDVRLMLGALKSLGYNITEDGKSARIIMGKGYSHLSKEVAVFLGNSGTATRILTALLSAGDGTFHIEGVPRMYERPIGDLVDALLPLCGNTEIKYDGKVGYPPLTIHARGLAGGKTTIRGNLSSQFVTGLLMAMPLCKNRVEVEVTGKLVSAPYVDLTLQVMKAFGAEVEREGYSRFWIEEPQGYKLTRSFEGTNSHVYDVEADASSASYFLAAAAITGGTVNVLGIGAESLQGEADFADKALMKMGAKVERHHSYTTATGAPRLHGIDIDMDLMSDTGMTLAVVALFAEGKTTIRNVGNWRLKETDRLKAMATELKKLCPPDEQENIQEGDNWISITPPTRLMPDVVIDTYDDHRMAMCFSLVSLGPKGVAVTINDPDCVRKTYPGYWDEFKRMTGVKDET